MTYTKNTPQRYVVYQRQTNSGTVVIPTSTITPRAATWIDVKSGTKVTDWKEKVRLQQDAGSAYTSNKARILSTTDGSVSHRIRQTSSPFYEYQTDFSGIGFNPSVPAHIGGHNQMRVESVALSKILKKINSELVHLNGAAVMAEFVDVLRQFGSPARAIIDLTNRRLNRLALERKGLSGSTVFKRIRWSEIVASTYLEYAFGLAPLIGDTMKAAEALARFNTEKELYKFRSKVVSRVSETQAVSVVDPTLIVNSVPGEKFTLTSTDYRCQYVVGLAAVPHAAFGSNERLIELLGFRPQDWIPALWEAVPWSWLLDYFTNIQEILNAAATSTAGVKWISKTTSSRTTQTVSTKWDFGRINKTNLVKVSGDHAGAIVSQRISINRTLPRTLGVPSLYFEHPFEDVWKVANMSAVLFARKPGQSALWIS